jgi:hypothetical protein
MIEPDRSIDEIRSERADKRASPERWRIGGAAKRKSDHRVLRGRIFGRSFGFTTGW